MVIKINALHVTYGRNVLQPFALPDCFGTKAKQEDSPLVQIQHIVGLLGGAITSIMVALASVWQRLQQAATQLGEDLTTHSPCPASPCLGHALKFMASSFNSLSEKRKKEVSIKVMGKYE